MEDTQKQLDKLTKDLQDLTDEMYLNNFSDSQDFNKFSRFNTRLKVPHYPVLPTVCEIGEIVEVNGILYIGSSINKFSKVGAQ